MPPAKIASVIVEVPRPVCHQQTQPCMPFRAATAAKTTHVGFVSADMQPPGHSTQDTAMHKLTATASAVPSHDQLKSAACSWELHLQWLGMLTSSMHTAGCICIDRACSRAACKQTAAAASMQVHAALENALQLHQQHVPKSSVHMGAASAWAGNVHRQLAHRFLQAPCQRHTQQQCAVCPGQHQQPKTVAPCIMKQR